MGLNEDGFINSFTNLGNSCVTYLVLELAGSVSVQRARHGPKAVTRFAHIIAVDRETVEVAWSRLRSWLADELGCSDDIDGILFLIGIQESQQSYVPNMEKNDKEQLVNEGTYCVLEKLGFYERVGMEADGRWIWEEQKSLPERLSVEEQETLLRSGIIRYFKPYLK